MLSCGWMGWYCFALAVVLLLMCNVTFLLYFCCGVLADSVFRCVFCGGNGDHDYMFGWWLVDLLMMIVRVETSFDEVITASKVVHNEALYELDP